MDRADDKKASKKFSPADRLKSFTFAFTGLKSLFSDEHNFRIHIVVLVLVIAAGIFFQISGSDWIAVLIVSGLVISAECFNSAIEYLCDIVSPEYNQKVRKIKDITAAGVLVSAIIAAITGLIVFIPEIREFLEKITGN